MTNNVRFFPLRNIQNANSRLGTDGHTHAGGEQKRGRFESQSYHQRHTSVGRIEIYT